VEPFRFEVDTPRRRCLLEAERVDTAAEGRNGSGVWETEVSAEVIGLGVVEKLRCDYLRMHMLVSRTPGQEPFVATKGNRIDGLRLGNVTAVVTIDDEALANAASADKFAEFHASARRPLGRFGAYWQSSIVREIQLVGGEADKQGMAVVANTIVWKGFGRIILGEIHVKAHDRRLTLVRLEMGSDAGGSGTAGDGQTNGEVGG
jgi:hypothetical protein